VRATAPRVDERTLSRVDDPSSATVGTLLERAIDAYARLAELGEEVDDEWSYIQDLTEAWRERFETIRAARAGDVLEAETATAVQVAIDEIGRIDDPHRAIDWLSTFPQVAITALGERP
jgi:hypothetical protein